MEPDETEGSARPAVLLVFVEVDEGDVEELDSWYRREHGPEKLGQPGYRSLRRFRAEDGSASFLALYELDGAEAGVNPPALSADGSARLEEIMAKWRRWSRSVWVQIDEQRGGTGA